MPSAAKNAKHSSSDINHPISSLAKTLTKPLGHAFNDSIEIRTYSSMQEIEALDGFVGRTPVNTDNYRALLGDYDFAVRVQCCRETSKGNLCGTKHKYGFVVVRTDGLITIVGNCCAEKKFGLNAKIKDDRARYINEQARQKRFARVYELITTKNERITELNILKAKIKNLKNSVNDFKQTLGPRTALQLTTMAKSGGNSILINAIYVKEYFDQNNKKKLERTKEATKLGILNGLGVFNDYTITTLRSQISHCETALEDACDINDSTKNSVIEALVQKIETATNIREDLARLENYFSLFLKNNLALICYLTSDKSDRFKSAQGVLRQLGKPSGRDKAKKWLIDHDQMIKDKLNADDLEILY